MQFQFKQLFPATGWRILLASAHDEEFSLNEVPLFTSGVAGGVLPLELRDPLVPGVSHHTAAFLVPGKSIAEDIQRLIRAKLTK